MMSSAEQGRETSFILNILTFHRTANLLGAETILIDTFSVASAAQAFLQPIMLPLAPQRACGGAAELWKVRRCAHWGI
jgi:hypothetical protein